MENLTKIKNTILENKKNLIVIFLVSLLLNIVFMTLVNIATNGNTMDSFFGADSLRIFKDMTERDYNHYRTSVHPLFILFTQPYIFILSRVFGKLVSAVFLQALAGAICASLFYISTEMLKLKKKTRLIMSFVFISLFSQISFNSFFETYIFAQLGLLAMWAAAIFFIDKKLNLIDYFIITCFGIFNLSITITNFFQFLIFLCLIIIFNKKLNYRLVKFLSIIVVSCSICVSLAQVQNIIWPSAPDFFKANLEGFLLNKNSEEFLYIRKTLTLEAILNQIKASTVYQFSIFNNCTGNVCNFIHSKVLDIVAIMAFLVFVSLNGLFVFENRKKFSKHKIYFGLLLAYLFNFILHLFYGPEESFLYILNYNFLILLILAYVINNSSNKITKSIRSFLHKRGLIVFVIYEILQIIGALKYFWLVSLSFGTNFPIPKSIYIIFIALLIILTICILGIRRIKVWLPVSIFLVCTTLVSVYVFNSYVESNDNIKFFRLLKEQESDYRPFMGRPDTRNMVLELAKYHKELGLQLHRENFYDHRFMPSNNKIKSNFFFFGMYDRRKIVYKEGKLIDLFTKKVIKDFKVKHELIVPSEYAVLIIDDKGKLIKIFENEKGVFIDGEDRGREILATSDSHFNLSSFAGFKYQRMLKVLLQEILFNFDNKVPKPNILAYQEGGGWYRDTMLVTMVLEKTKNTHLLEPWVDSLSDIYDHERFKMSGNWDDYKEADNPGELLYILGAIKNNRSDLIKMIMDEVSSKSDDGVFSGVVDGSVMSYYPTVLLINGAKKAKVDLPVNLKVPNPDPYTPLTWWAQDIPRINTKANVDHPKYPYLSWASAHYLAGIKATPVYLLDWTYPLSYEAHINAATAKKQKFISKRYSKKNGAQFSHAWCAAEMFLLLSEL